ncbi:MAG TPA: hydroxysqualene dehydroxylase HpnE [Solirubrobacteraceae bacterium]|nr:hydroxysqualene dehydroxylase HpnE [Solirubrobacteraceae bacterium]
MSEQRHVVVVGGGLAGITAALDAADGGARVTLLEVRRRLGGAAYSVTREGLEMDNGQHVFLRGCIAYRGLLARLGSEHLVAVQPRLEIPVLRPGHEPFRLRRSSLPAPLHLAPALARYPHLSPRQRLSAVRAAFALGRIDPAELRLDRITLGEWLTRHGQGAQAIAALWDLIALPTLNLPAEQASLALGAFVFRMGLLSSASAGDIGFHVGTLSQILDAPAQRALRRAGVEVRLGWGAERLLGGAPQGVLSKSGQRAGESLQVHGRDGEQIDADALILAVPHTRAARLLEPLLGQRAASLRDLGASPIVNLHVVYDRVVCDYPFAAGVESPVQYIFDRSAAAGAPAGCQYLAVSLSGAEREMRLGVQELRERYLPALATLLPRARDARVESFLVTREHAATFRAGPGVEALRPAARTPIPGLLLAGTWTATGWPATLESAVLSGHEAAAQALVKIGLGGSGRGGARADASSWAGAPSPALQWEAHAGRKADAGAVAAG